MLFRSLAGHHWPPGFGNWAGRARACVSPRLEPHPGVASKTRALRSTQRLRGHQTRVQPLWGSSHAIYAWAGVDQMEAETPHPFPHSNQDVPPSAPGPRRQPWGVTGRAPPSWLSKCSLYTFALKKTNRGFPGGAVVENPPANAGDTGSSPGPGRSHMPRGN